MGRQKTTTLPSGSYLCYTVDVVKLKAPLISLNARGTLSKAITFVRRRRQNIAEKKPEIIDVGSAGQLLWRPMFLACVDLWHALSAAEKQEWESSARPRHMTGYAWYLSQCLRPNPGIYLPLVGGSMSGVIAMAGNQVSGLPAPVAANDAARKAYVDALAPDVGEGHITILPYNYNSIGAGVWSIDISALNCLCYTWVNAASQANGDNYVCRLFLAAGTYTMRVLYLKHTNNAICDILIGGVEVGSLDLYGVTARNQVWTTAGIVIAASGLTTLRVRADGKNALSTAWRVPIGSICLWRTP